MEGEGRWQPGPWNRRRLPSSLAVTLPAVLRHQLPVYSPVTWEAIAAGLRAAVRGDPDGVLRRRVEGILELRYGARDVLLTDSGTSALRLAIAGALRGRRHRPVALPGYCCYDVATAAEGAGAPVALYDLDPATLGPDFDSLGGLSDAAPGAVVVAHLYGYPVDVHSVREVIGDAALIEDAAQGAGGTLHGRPLGSLGSVSVLSFGRGKGMTGGGGGALLGHDDLGVGMVEWARSEIACQDPNPPAQPAASSGVGAAPARRAPSAAQGRGIRQVGKLAVQHVLGRPALYGLPAALPFLHLGETLYRPPRTPQPAPAGALAVLERILPEVDRETAIRRANAERWRSGLARSAPFGTVTVLAGAQPGYLRLPLLAGTDSGAEDLRSLQRWGVMPGYPTTLAALPSLGPALIARAPALPGAERLAKELLTLPTHRRLSPRDVAAVTARVGGL